MYVHEGKRLIYLAHPRTASVATAACLKDLGFVHPEGLDHHAQIHEFGMKNRAGWTTFTAIRNHYDACASWMFRSSLARSCNWSEYLFLDILQTNHWLGPNKMWWLHEDADRILRFENLAVELQSLLIPFGFRDIKLQRLHVSDNRKGLHYREVYTKKMRDTVASRFADEIKQYGYEF